MALRSWEYGSRQGSRLHSVQLGAKDGWPERLVGFSSHGWHSFIRRGAPNRQWAERTRTIDRPQYIDVKIPYSIGLQHDTIVLARPQYRKAQPAKKTYSLAQALRQSAQAIAAKRG